jgi:hypothetical protein
MLGTALPATVLALLLTFTVHTNAQRAQQIIFSGREGSNVTPSSGSGTVSSDVAGSVSSEIAGGCDVRGWLRAPDLLPGHIIDGDVHLLINGTHPDCFNISSAHLGLRHKERGVVRYPSPAAELPAEPKNDKDGAGCSRSNGYRIREDRYDIWYTPHWQRFGRSLVEDVTDTNDTYLQEREEWRKRMAEHDLWTVRVDETTDFEVLHPESIVGETNGPLELLLEQEDLQQAKHKIANFSLAVPNVNFPPSLAQSGSMSGHAQHVRIKSDQQTEYLITISWDNGTQIELPVGTTVWVPQESSSASANGTDYEEDHTLVSARALTHKEARRQQKLALVGEEHDLLDWGEEGNEEEREGKFCGADRRNNVTLTLELPSTRTLVQGKSYNFSVAIEYDADHPERIKDVRGSHSQGNSFPWAEQVVRDAGMAPAYLHELLEQGHVFASQDTIYDQTKAPSKRQAWMREHTKVVVSALSNETAVEGHPGRVRKQASVLVSVQPKEFPTTVVSRFITRENHLRFSMELYCANDHGQAAQKDPLDEVITRASEGWTHPISPWKETFYDSLEASFPVKVAPVQINGTNFGLRAHSAQVDDQFTSYRSPSARAPVFLAANQDAGGVDAPLLSETRRSTSEILSQEQLEKLAQSSRRGKAPSSSVIKPYHRNACKHSPSSLSLCSAGDEYAGPIWRDFVWSKEEKPELKNFFDDPMAWILDHKVD